MYHLIIWLNLLSLCLSVALMGLAGHVYLEYRTKFLRYFLYLQSLMIVCILSNLVFEYLITNLPQHRSFLIAWNLGNFIWSPFFVYFSLMHNFVSSGMEPSPRLSASFKGISALLVFPVLIPLLGGNGDLADRLTRFSTWIVLPACVGMSFFALAVKSLRYRRVRDPFNRFIMLNSIAMNAITGPALLLLIVTRPSGSGLYHTPLKLGIDLFFLVWSVQALNYFRFFLLRHGPAIAFLKANRELSSPDATPSGARPAPEREDAADFQALRELMEREKPYLDPALDLPALAAKAGMARNRLSHLINACAGASFSDYVNAHRVARAKELLRGGSRSSVLQVAFESGFNSKATFYAAFKRETGQSPTEFRDSAR